MKYEKNMKLHEAVIFAAKAHEGQNRKGTDIDYLSHPMEVLGILAAAGADPDLQMAGILHDTLEDTDATAEQIGEQFGEEVLSLVQGHSEDKSRSWKERKQTNIDLTKAGDIRYKMLIAADMLSNVRSMYSDWKKVGDTLWDRFNAKKEDEAWYYHGLLDALAPLGEDSQIPARRAVYDEISGLVEELFPEE
ncbi:MAG: HD domain-containing protein [Anaerovoracaceae bacterium]|nr:HD domain-containing protein [Bacillota bacterium]MDY2670661.1 HD domain-containing protein [Anaerovoracaceae bacterium]